MKKVQFLKKTVSSCQKQSAKPPGSNSSHRLRFVLELRCDICDLFPPFADIRKWLETITEINSINRFNSAILTIDCSGYITTITIHQVEWRELPSSSNRSVPLPVSILMVWRKGCRHDDRFVCFCDTNRTVKNFYHSLMDVLKRHSSLFNSEQHWHAVSGRGIMVSEKYRAQLFLKRIEYL